MVLKDSTMKNILILFGIFLLLISCKNKKSIDKNYESESLKIIQLTENTFLHISYLQTNDYGKVPCNGLVFYDNNEAIIIETPTNNRASVELIKWVENEFQPSTLSKADQMLIEAASSMENDVMMAEYNAKNGAALATLLTEHGVKLRKFSEDTYDSFGEASDEVFADVVKHSPLAKEIHESFVKARTEVGGWAKISDQAYVQERNRVLGL